MIKPRNLYKVTLKGMQYGSGSIHGVAYVVATDAEIAYQRVKKALEENKIGTSRDRELDKVELIAVEGFYSESDHQLFIGDGE